MSKTWYASEHVQKTFKENVFDPMKEIYLVLEKVREVPYWDFWASLGDDQDVVNRDGLLYPHRVKEGDTVVAVPGTGRPVVFLRAVLLTVERSKPSPKYPHNCEWGGRWDPADRDADRDAR